MLLKPRTTEVAVCIYRDLCAVYGTRNPRYRFALIHRSLRDGNTKDKAKITLPIVDHPFPFRCEIQGSGVTRCENVGTTMFVLLRADVILVGQASPASGAVYRRSLFPGCQLVTP